MSLFRTVVALTALLIAAPLCLAQSDQATESGSPSDGDQSASRKQYQVEVLTFQYRGPDSSGGEQLDRLYVEDYLPSDPFDIDEYNRVREAVSFTEMVHLRQAAERLKESAYYEILASAAWVQPLLGRGEAVDVPLGESAPGSEGSLQGDFAAPSPAEASGTVTIYGDYLLFADLDIRVALTSRSTGAGLGNTQSFGTDGGLSSGGSALDNARSVNGSVAFHISERRRIKLDEVHYFDHPYIGALLWVTRYEQNQEAGATAE